MVVPPLNPPHDIRFNSSFPLTEISQPIYALKTKQNKTKTNNLNVALNATHTDTREFTLNYL